MAYGWRLYAALIDQTVSDVPAEHPVIAVNVYVFW